MFTIGQFGYHYPYLSMNMSPSESRVEGGRKSGIPSFLNHSQKTLTHAARNFFNLYEYFLALEMLLP